MKLLKKVLNKFRFAFAGLIYGLCNDSSIQIQYSLGIITIIAGIFLKLSVIEWSIILILIGLVIAIEYLNSCVEDLVDLHFKAIDPLAKKIKDMSAASVLIISVVAMIVGLIIFISKL
ncbi:MAG: diacylglycerol kinase family protein [Erysipelotrichaceae bacterium]